MSDIPINVKLSKSQIEELLNKLSAGYLFNENIVVDGIPICLNKVRIKDLNYGINVYIAGELKGAWIEKKYSDIVSKVWCKRTSKLYKKSDYTRLRKVFGKKKADEKIKPIEYYSWCFTSTKRLILTLAKANEVRYFGIEDELINPIIRSFKDKHPEMFNIDLKVKEKAA